MVCLIEPARAQPLKDPAEPAARLRYRVVPAPLAPRPAAGSELAFGVPGLHQVLPSARLYATHFQRSSAFITLFSGLPLVFRKHSQRSSFPQPLHDLGSFKTLLGQMRIF